MNVTYPGARWWKFDFHNHTPVSKDTYWATKPIKLTPEAWLRKYMIAGIDCVAITDHNSGEWIDPLKDAYTRMKEEAKQGLSSEIFRELYIFPGVEISVQGGLHVLAIFDPQCSTATITSLLGGVGFPASLHGETDSSKDAACTRSSLIEVVEEIHRCGGLAIPAHSDKSKGLLETTGSANQGARHPDAIRSVLNASILAIETVDRTAPKPAIFQSSGVKWTEVLGSDCHSFGSPHIPGGRFTWVKMEKPSKDGLRLALLDGQGISIRRSDDADGFDPTRKPEHFVHSIEISDARYMGVGGQPQKFLFSPFLNTIVGGRGTGKSTIVHALRLAFGRNSELPANSEAQQTFDRFVALGKGQTGGLLEKTRIVAQVNRDGVPFELLWQNNGTDNVVNEWDAATANFKKSPSQSVSQQRFPLRLFSQGQIAALAGDSQQALLKVIDNAADVGILHSRLDEEKRSFLSLRAQVRELDGKLAEYDLAKQKLQDVQRKLDRFENTDHAAILKKYQQKSREHLEITRQIDFLETLAKSIDNLTNEFQREALTSGLFELPDDASALQIVAKVDETISSACASTQEIAARMRRTRQELRAELSNTLWSYDASHAVFAYQELLKKLKEQEVNDPSEYSLLVDERQNIEDEIKILKDLKDKRDELEQKALAQLENILYARKSISKRRVAFLKDSLEGNNYVRMALIPYSRDPAAIDRSLRETLGITEGKYADDLYVESADESPSKGLVGALLAPFAISEKNGEWQTDTFEKSIDDIKQKLTQACLGENKFGARFNKALRTESLKRSELIDHILCWFPEDGLNVEYSRKGDGKDFRSISQGSAGQRAAAMLAFLLAHGSEPLVLDQPEDDLDNHLIYDLVVQQIRSNKARRQLIIVTHNPNIVVNGDAEFIHVLDFTNQCTVKHQGSLQSETVRQEICLVMEGGKEAFRRRYQRLGGNS